MTPSDLGFLILIILLTFSEVRSYHRAKKLKHEQFEKSVSVQRPL